MEEDEKDEVGRAAVVAMDEAEEVAAPWLPPGCHRAATGPPPGPHRAPTGPPPGPHRAATWPQDSHYLQIFENRLRIRRDIV